ncbi:MAG: hypothetical protein IJ634_00620 [Bacteroidales bacterium]|nr:hypothetical protein [Bacteroidales bacterium]
MKRITSFLLAIVLCASAFAQLGNNKTERRSDLSARGYLLHYEEMVRSVTVKQLIDLAKRYINLRNYAAVSLRPDNPDAGQAD